LFLSLAQGPKDKDMAMHTVDFNPISLAELDGVQLLDRTDTKFVLSEAQLDSTLAALGDSYRVLDIHGVRRQRYRTVYFDTPALDLYHLHHKERARRQKVRTRTYLDSGLAFVEVKCKSNKGRTVKYRTPTPGLQRHLMGESLAFVAEHVSMDVATLLPVLTNDFLRVTLVNAALTERVTIDVDVIFSVHRMTEATLGGLAIVEVKQSNLDRSSVLMRRLHDTRVQPVSVSKYCTGVALLGQA
jgi:VTC domain